MKHFTSPLRACRHLFKRWRRRQRMWARYAALQQLDDRTLRDIGVQRSELMSLAAGVDLTRTRSVAA